MNKKELISAIVEKTEQSVSEVTKALDGFIEVVGETIVTDKVIIPGFGTFELKDVPERDGINPKTKEVIRIPASKKPNFKFLKAFKEKFNK